MWNCETKKRRGSSGQTLEGLLEITKAVKKCSLPGTDCEAPLEKTRIHLGAETIWHPSGRTAIEEGEFKAHGPDVALLFLQNLCLACRKSKI